MTKTVCDICGTEMETPVLGHAIDNLNFCISSYGKAWDICNGCRMSLNKWITERKQESEDKK